MSFYNKSNIRLEKIRIRQLKPKYKGLSAKQKKIIKLTEQKELLEKSLYGYRGYYTTFPKKPNREIDFSKIDQLTLNHFDCLRKKLEKVNQLLNAQDDETVSQARRAFTAINTHSQSF